MRQKKQDPESDAVQVILQDSYLGYLQFVLNCFGQLRNTNSAMNAKNFKNRH